MDQVICTIKGMRCNDSDSRKPLPFATVKANAIVISSPLGDDASLNDHLVWLWGILQGERRYLKSLQADGGTISIQAIIARQPAIIDSDGAQMIHLLGATLTIERA